MPEIGGFYFIDIRTPVAGPNAGCPSDAPTTSPLYGRRSGKALAAYQRELVRTLLPRLAIDVRSPIVPRALFRSPRADLWLEIGFGGGEHLLSAAGHHRNIGFIGCEPFLNGMARALTDLATADLENVRFHCGDAGELIDALPPASLGRVFIFYPDPWPKRRHKKRRFVSDEMLRRLARAMRQGAELRFATDIDDYCGWILVRLPALAGFSLDGRTGRRLAGSLARLARHALRT